MRIWNWIKRSLTPSATLELPPYRRIVSRVPSQDGNGEIVTMECGHTVRFVVHRRESFPCEACSVLEREK